MRIAPLLPAVAAIVVMVAFSATLLPYFTAHRAGTTAGYAPLAAGAFVAAGLAGLFTYIANPSGSARIFKALGAAVVVAAAFVLLFFFVVLNTLGS